MKLCNRCIERFKRLGKKPEAEACEVRDCEVCKGLFSRDDEMLERVREKVKEYDFDSFLVGCVLKDKVLDSDEKLKKELGIEGVNGVKQDVNRYFGTTLSNEWGKEVSFEDPEVIITVDYIGDKIELQLKPLYVYGKYKKLERGIPQTRWPCRACRGAGNKRGKKCEDCEGTGKQYQESVEELIAKPFMKASKARDHAFHGSGREDIDALMLGTGRPFVLELRDPVKRDLDLKELKEKVNEENAGRVEVNDLRYSDKKEVVTLKEAVHDKVYKARVKADGEVSKEDLEKLNALQDVELEQFTPTRVQHRRAKKTRNRKVYHVRVLESKDDELVLEIKASSGTYIKEFISSDDGNTKPSIAGVLGKKCACIELDVLKVCEV